MHLHKYIHMLTKKTIKLICKECEPVSRKPPKITMCQKLEENFTNWAVSGITDVRGRDDFKLLQHPEVVLGIFESIKKLVGAVFLALNYFLNNGGRRNFFTFIFEGNFTSNGGSFRSIIVCFSICILKHFSSSGFSVSFG